jgi:hypothetical protein
MNFEMGWGLTAAGPPAQTRGKLSSLSSDLIFIPPRSSIFIIFE